MHLSRLQPAGSPDKDVPMITCHVRYLIHPAKVQEFEAYARLWIPLVRKFGGIHHGYLLPFEPDGKVALASFSFPSMAAFKQYRQDSRNDAQCQAALRFAEETQCIQSYEGSFFRPVFD